MKRHRITGPHWKDSQGADRRPKGMAGNEKDVENVQVIPYRIERSPNSLGHRICCVENYVFIVAEIIVI